MKNILNPVWIIIANVIPVVLFSLILWGNYRAIDSLLTDENINYWLTFGLVLIGLIVVNICYTIILYYKKWSISIFYGFIVLVSYSAFIYIFSFNHYNLISSNIPTWAISDKLLLYVFTFFMPTLIHSVFIIIVRLTPENKKQKAWLNLLFAMLIPIGFYFFVEIVLPFWKPLGFGFKQHFQTIIYTIAIIFFIFFFIRWIYILATKKNSFWREYPLFWKIPFTMIFPILGLVLNNDDTHIMGNNIFGDFNSFWFYCLALVNGILLSTSGFKHKVLRLLFYVGKSVTLAFTFYFFLVFLPFLPLSMILIVFFGSGILMLTPIILFMIHINELKKDFKFLLKHYSSLILIFVLMFSFLLIPTLITYSYINDKPVMDEALEYLYNPNYQKKYNIDLVAVERFTRNIKSNKKQTVFFSSNHQKPYISAYYNWLVLDNMTLSNKKLNYIGQVFFGNKKKPVRRNRMNILTNSTEIININTDSHYNVDEDYWTTWVNLEIENNSKTFRQAEYSTSIKLPEGVWIDDYYLYVGNKKEKGILTEKKTAMWVYNKIRNTRRDPGILYYLTANKVIFKVFPFSKNETRKTGIRFIHKEPINIKLDNNIVHLGKKGIQKYVGIETESSGKIIYFSSEAKKNLLKIKRQPYYHFFVDVSAGNKENLNNYIKRIEILLSKNKILKDNKISFVNAFTETLTMNQDWKNEFENQKFVGSFYLDMAIKKTLIESYSKNDNKYPIFIVITDNLKEAIIDYDYSDLKFCFPDNDLFYSLDRNNQLASYSLLKNSKKIVEESASIQINNDVVVWNDNFKDRVLLPNNDEASIAIKQDFIFDYDNLMSDNWQSGLIIHCKWISQLITNKDSNKKWMELIKNSFQSKILTPFTSYIVVENEIQKAIIKKKQEQVLSGSKLLDLDNDPQRMSEPGQIIVLVFLALFFLFYKRKK